MDPFDFRSIFLEASEFRDRYRMGNNRDRPMSRRVCLALAGILEKEENTRLLGLVSDEHYEQRLAALGQTWGNQLRHLTRELLSFLETLQQSSTLPERQVRRWLQIGFLKGDYQGDQTGIEAADYEKYFDRSIANIKPIIKRLNQATKFELNVSRIAEDIRISDGSVSTDRAEAVSLLSDPLLFVAYEQLYFLRRSPTISYELARFLGDAFTLIGINVPEILLQQSALKFCRKMRPKKHRRKLSMDPFKQER
ncbi:MAG TPA: hypothetical protein PKM55_12005 [Acidobacteriota bacterium]|nr:hypothetical protein [Acidobacteriota bacterium]